MHRHQHTVVRRAYSAEYGRRNTEYELLMRSRPIVALDIGSTKVACAIGASSSQGGSFQLTGGSLVPYPFFLETWLGDPLLVSQTIEQALDSAGAGSPGEVAVAMASPMLSSEKVQVSIPLADEPIVVRTKDLQRLQERALDQALGIDREALVVERLSCSGNGFESVSDPRGLSATRLSGTFHIVTMPIALRQRLIQILESAGLEMTHLFYSLSATAAAFDEGSHPHRMLLIDLGGLSTQVGLFVEGRLRSSVSLAWGGLTLAFELSQLKHLTMEQAVSLSLEGCTSPDENLRRCLDPHLEVLSRSIQQFLHGQTRPDGVYLSGRAALMDGIVEWVEKTVGLNPTIYRPAHAQAMSGLSQQVGMSSALGVLNLLACQGSSVRSPWVVNRLLERTRAILTEYF